MAPEERRGSRTAGGALRNPGLLPALPRAHSPIAYSSSPRGPSEVSSGEERTWARPHGGVGAGFDLLPPALDAALDEHLASVALEDWRRTHGEPPGHRPRAAYESPVLACEARLRKLDRLSQRMKPPNEVLTAMAYDLLHSSIATLAPAARSLCERLARHVEDAIYSEEPSAADVTCLAEMLNHPTERLPHFLVVRRQQVALDRKEQRARETQQIVEAHLEQHHRMLEIMKLLQLDERRMLRQWLLSFWVVTFRQRQHRINRMAAVVLNAPLDALVPLACWRLYVSQQRWCAVVKQTEVVGRRRSEVAQYILQVQARNDTQRKALQEANKATAALQSECRKEQQERARLQRLWDEAQPELLMSVLAQTLGVFFDIIMRVAHFSSLELRQRLAGKDISPMMVGMPVGVPLQGMMLEEVLTRWVNRALALGRTGAQEQLHKKGISQSNRALLQSVKNVKDVCNLARDLGDSMALCTLFAVLNARRDGRAIAAKDLWPLGERDTELRAAHVCGLLSPLGQTRKARCLLDPRAIAYGESGATSVFLACCFLEDPMLSDIPKSVDANGRAAMRQQLEDLISGLEAHAGGAAFELPEDPTPLLPGADLESLTMASAEQLLLRWVNVQIGHIYSRPVENFGSDLQDGLAIGLLLTVVAPEVIEQPLAGDFEGRLDQVIIAATRCTELEILTAAAIVDGQSDMLACFFAQLFLSRPNLAAKPDSLLAMHLQFLERLCRKGLTALSAPADSGEIMAICMELEAHWSELMLAAQTVQQANKAMQETYNRMRTFLGDTLLRRAQGKPRTMLDAKEAREFALYTTLSMERLAVLFAKETIDSSLVCRLEEMLRKHFRLLREIFQYYTASSGNVLGVTLEGLLIMYQDCKLRSKDLVPHHLEVLYYGQMDGSSKDKALTPQGFVEILLQLASLRFRSSADLLDDQLSCLVEQHLKTHACQDADCIFQTISYQHKVRRVLDDDAKVLRIIFRVYASMDASSTEALLHVNTMNIKEFGLLLSHCDMLDETLTEEVTQEIFDSIQDGATNAGPDDGEGLNDDEELAFTEFLDGLVAIAAYKFPDPFTPFHRRVSAFIKQLFTALKKYWSRKRISPQVDLMLNVLQKRLR